MERFEYTTEGYWRARQYLISAGVPIDGGFSTDGWSIVNRANDHYSKKHKTMEWISTDIDLPSEGQEVLVYAGNYSQEYKHHVATFRRGITIEEREKMRIGDLPNPYYQGTKRSEVYMGCDEHGNNEKPYIWDVSPLTLFGQYVTHWMPLPDKP